jgi:hypothetical protein
LIDGIKSSEVRDQDPNQLGKRHRCVRAGDAPELVYQRREDHIESVPYLSLLPVYSSWH